MKIYVVNYKETFLNDTGMKIVNSGVCKDGYAKEDDAKRRICEMVDGLYNKHIEEVDSEMEKDDHNEEIYDDSDESGRWHCFHRHGDSFEYWITDIEVEGL